MAGFDTLLKDIGDLSKIQIIIYCMVCYYLIFNGFNLFASNFVAYEPMYRCAFPEIDENFNLTEDEILNFTTPYDVSSGEYLRCFRYGYNLTDCNGTLNCIDKNAPIIRCDQGYRYDKSIFEETIVTEFDLVCDRTYLVALSTSMYQIGIALSCPVFGYISDRFGRKPICVFAFAGALAANFGVAYSYSITSFTILRFIESFFDNGVTIATFIYIMELTTTKWRDHFGTGYQAWVVFGYMIQAGLSYHWRNWHHLMLAGTIVGSPFLLFACIVPESPRWLFTNNKVNKGKKVLESFARFNGKEINEKHFDNFEENMEILSSNNYMDMFRYSNIRIITMKILLMWFVTTLSFYGVALNVGSLSGDIFVNTLLNGATEIISYILQMLLQKRIGQRILLFGSFILGSLGLLSSSIISEVFESSTTVDGVILALALLGKFGTSVGLSVCYNFTTEIYPTAIRGTGLSVGSISGGIGGILAPFVILLQQYKRWIPNVIFSTLGFLAAVVALTFPNVNGVELMTSIEEAENFYKSKKTTICDVKKISEINEPIGDKL